MTRDELLLLTLAEGEASTVELAAATGIGERTCRYGLQHLVETGYVWSPERGRYRLTARGREIAADIPALQPTAAQGEAAVLQAAASRPLDLTL
jgi:DNA-binding IclR family transcriptional regulator